MSAGRAVTCVIGAGGLLGKALLRALPASGSIAFALRGVTWNDPSLARSQLAAGLETLAGLAAAHGVPWRIAWCAGAGVTGTSADLLRQEVETFAAFLGSLRTLRPGEQNLLFVASSAGGVYAGGRDAPFTEKHAVAPISDYGRAKVACEAAADAFAHETGTPTVIGRISNLYGPGQNLAKPQGLVSQLCRAHVTGQPLSIYVSLDTLRDYLFVDDCAAMIAGALHGIPAGERGDGATVKILAAAQPTTIGALIGECRRVFKRSPRIVLGTSANARYQVRDLRMRSTVWPALDRRALTTIPAGIAATAQGMIGSLSR